MSDKMNRFVTQIFMNANYNEMNKMESSKKKPIIATKLHTVLLQTL